MDPQQTFWDDAAPRWDALLADGGTFVNHQESFRRFHWFLKRSLKIGNRTNSYRLLDLGCGTGEAAWPLWKRVASVTFFDRSTGMLRLARNKYPKGIFVRGDAAQPPFLDAEFDVIVSRGALLSLLEPELVPQTLEQLWRIMRPQGFLLFDFLTEPALWPSPVPVYRSGWRRSEMEALIRARLPAASVMAYDGTEAHAMNRILIKKT
jgi:ubiquinone/menaquinone biosynthesis C-methylase UbiE